MAASLSIAPFCTWADITNRLSAVGAALRIDDAPPQAQAWVLGRATVEVLGYLWSIYHDNGLPSVNNLSGSNQVREFTADIGAFHLCRRRNHPPPKSVEQAYKDAIDQLTKLRAGRWLLWDCPQNKANVPVLSNQRVTLLPFPRIVVVTGKSTGNPQMYDQFADSTDGFPYDW